MISTDYEHLADEARAVIDRSAPERLTWFQEQDNWIPYPHAIEALSHIEELIAKPRRSRMRGLLVIGESNNGKSRLAQECVAKHPLDPNPDGDHVRLPLMYLEVPPKPDEAAILDSALISLNQPFRRKDSLTERREQLVRIMRRCEVKALLLDEVPRLLGSKPDIRRVVMDAFRYIANQVPVPLVAFATKRGANALASSDEMINRMHPITLPTWLLDSAFRALLADFESLLPLRKPSNLTKPSTVALIHVMSGGLIGEVRDLLEAALMLVFARKKESIDEELLRQLGWVAPEDRKRLIGVPGKAA